MKNPQEKLAILNIWSRNVTTSTRETTTRAWICDVRMAQFVLKIEKLSHIMGPRGSQDLRSPSPIMAPGLTQYSCTLWYMLNLTGKYCILFSNVLLNKSSFIRNFFSKQRLIISTFFVLWKMHPVKPVYCGFRSMEAFAMLENNNLLKFKRKTHINFITVKSEGNLAYSQKNGIYRYEIADSNIPF